MAALRTVILLLAITTLVSAQCNILTAKPFFQRSVYEFTLKLVRRISQETDNHFVASALSPWTLLSAISMGASDTTLAEIKEVLKLHPNKCFNDLYFKLAKKISNRSSPNPSMFERSSTIFFDETLSVKQEFLEEVEKVGVCDAKIVSFYDTAQTAATINSHVSGVTNEAIDEIVTANDLEGVLLVLVDALYFKGAWKIAFPYEDTEISAFYNEKGEQIGDVSLMYVSGVFNMTSVRQIQAKVLELPYGENSRYSMLLFLPYRNTSLSYVIDSLRRISLTTIDVLFSTYGAETVDVQIPKFKISSEIDNLKELLIDMGLRTMFDDNKASLSGISDYMINVSDFIQKADIEVTEDGTTASSATAAMFESRMLPDQFVANRPFLFMIVDKYLRVPVFTGAYSKPSNF